MIVYFSVVTAMAGEMKFSRMSVFFVRSILLVNSTAVFLCIFYKSVDACMYRFILSNHVSLFRMLVSYEQVIIKISEQEHSSIFCISMLVKLL